MCNSVVCFLQGTRTFRSESPDRCRRCGQIFPELSDRTDLTHEVVSPNDDSMLVTETRRDRTNSDLGNNVENECRSHLPLQTTTSTHNHMQDPDNRIHERSNGKRRQMDHESFSS